MKDRAFIYKFATQVGVFRIQPHGEKWGLFIDYPEGDFDLLTSCVSPDDGVDYVDHQDTGHAPWDELSSVPDQIRDLDNWERTPIHP